MNVVHTIREARADRVRSGPIGMQVLWAHRFSHWAVGRAWPVRSFSRLLEFLIIRALAGAAIAPSAQIGKRVGFVHDANGLVISPYASIGDDCVLFHQVTIGILGSSPPGPKLGKRVVVGAGAKILGAIHIGDDARIGANSVVLQDVPSGYTAAGVPARLSPPS